MANSSKPKGGARGGRMEPQMSRDNMLSLAVILLFVAIISFGLGILVDRFQQSRKSTTASESGQVERLPEGKGNDTKTAAREPKKETPRQERAREASEQGSQISPSPVVLPGDKAGVTAPPSRPLSQREPNSTYVAAPPPRRPEETTPATPSDKPAAPATPVESPAAPAPVQMADNTTPAAAPVATPSPAAPEKPVEKAAEKPADQPAEKPAASSGAFTVQVGSFDTQANAEKYKKSVADKSDYEVTLHKSKDGKVVKACIGTYPDKASALKAREELIRIKVFKDCFVKAVSEL